MRRAGLPNGLGAVGYTEADIERLVEGTLPQHRVTRLCPRPFSREELARVFQSSLRCW
jgi:hydroxyacid-oxoacid transhydrogenase